MGGEVTRAPRALLRQTPVNQYSLNAVSALLDLGRIPWATWRTAEELARRLTETGGRGAVLYSLMTADLEWVGAEVAAVQKRHPEAVLVAGGPHPTADPAGTLGLGFHHAFVGEAERTLGPFMAAGAEGESVIRDPEGGPEDLDAYPSFGEGRHGPVELTRGCRWACGFCAVGGRPVRHRSPEAVLAAGRALAAAGRRTIAFITPDALSYRGGLLALDELLGRLGALGLAPVLGAFPSEVRPERVTPEAAALVRRRCHNRTLVIGAQSGSDRVLRYLGRGHRVEDAVTAARVTREAGLLPHVDVIFGLPGETPEDQGATLDLAHRLRREARARLHAHYFHPLPGTPLWGAAPTPLDEGVRRGLLALRAAGAEDGHWQAQEGWAGRVLAWVQDGVIRTPWVSPLEAAS